MKNFLDIPQKSDKSKQNSSWEHKQNLIPPNIQESIQIILLIAESRVRNKKSAYFAGFWHSIAPPNYQVVRRTEFYN